MTLDTTQDGSMNVKTSRNFDGMARVVGLAAMALESFAGVASGQTYHVVDLGSLGGIGDADAFAISGQVTPATVVGFATEFTQNHRALLRYNGASGAISPLSPDVQNVAFAIDGFGQVYGVSYTLGNLMPRAFRANGAGETSLGNFTARGCNGAGDVAGTMPVMRADGIIESHACFYESATGVLTDLGTLGGTGVNSSAFAVNSERVVVGQSDGISNSGTRAVAWGGGVAHDLGTLGGNAGGAYAINSSNIAAGWGRTGGTGAGVTNHAAKFVLSPSGGLVSATDLGALAAPPGSGASWSYAYGINEAGDIVGQSNAQGFIVRASGTMQNLNAMIPSGQGWMIVTARAIDSKRRIAGMAVNGVNLPRPVLLVPCDADVTRDGSVTVQDVFDFLALWFASDPRADFNTDGSTSVQDVFDFLAGWFSGCEG